MKMNYVLGCYEASFKKSKGWQEVDAETNNLVASLTYIVLFVNDQIYSNIVSVGADLKRSPLFRHEVKRGFNNIKKCVDAYNTNIFRIAKVNELAFADITQLMEDDIKPAIDTYYYAVSQVLLNHGVAGMQNRVASLLSVINMLSQVTRITIDGFGREMADMCISGNPLEYLNMDRIEKLSDGLSGHITKVHVNLNEEPSIIKAFNCVAKKLFNPDVFEKVFAI